jgi:hypothetical protein
MVRSFKLVPFWAGARAFSSRSAPPYYAIPGGLPHLWRGAVMMI